MAPTDFLLLYQELGLTPECSIDELKQAYRRRIAAIHPDRQRVPDSNRLAAIEQLQSLNGLYGAATAFHRRFGRLPGTTAARPSADVRASSAVVAPPQSRLDRRPDIALVCGVAIAISLFLLLHGDPDPGAYDRARDSGNPTHATSARSWLQYPLSEPASLIALKIGMTKEDVLAIELEPITRGEDRWDYGPSWIAFKHGKVTDWYSSRLHPLPSASTQPESTSTANEQVP